jgi:hypothetical protein
VYLAVRVLPKESHGHGHCQAVGLQQMHEDILLLCGVPEAGLEAAQAGVFSSGGIGINICSVQWCRWYLCR